MGATVLFVNSTKIYQFKAKNDKIKNIPSAQEIFQKIVQPTTHKNFFSVDYKTFDTSSIINIHKYLMKKHDIKTNVQVS